jgi:hypothetical protein
LETNIISRSNGGAGQDERKATLIGGDPALVPRIATAKENHLEVRDVGLILDTYY